ncbi:unnamed protein product [Rotaria sp. Silwood1]|nr:unnamed protein product [Rotaria sp. Silwood1]CAF3838843.1 unnamed protein product [Rotaria sp. Silwood1]CAF3854560.1 unnamed protein product [Rotaria sp. Silwood1]
MFNSQIPCTSRASRLRQQRLKKKQAASNILNKVESYGISSDDDSVINFVHDCSMVAEENIKHVQDDLSDINNYSNANVSSYKPDDHDTYWNENLTNLYTDSSPPLYKNSHTSLKAAVTTIISLAIEFNLPKIVVERLLTVFKSFLPTPNLLPTTHTSLFKTIGVTPISLTKYYCNSCFTLCTLRCGKKFCENNKCKLMKQSLRNRDISEVVTMDIKQQLKSIITRNISLFRNTEFFHPFDINSGSYYKNSMALKNELHTTPNNTIYQITLNIHTDGAPLVRTTKSCLWPCLASVVELPSQVRERQSNIVVLSLWTSSIKPDVNLFMNDCIEQLLDLSNPFKLIINNLDLYITVKTQLFLSDLPAKALFWKTINYNGYSACSSCTSEGVCRNRRVFYPYNKNNYRHRTHAEFLATARVVENRFSSKRNGGTIDGVKGLSPLLRIFEYPKQIIFDYMHLCCLGHMSTLIRRWLPMLNNEAIAQINFSLFSQQFPHNMCVKFNFPLDLYTDWKAKHFRIFILCVGLPYMVFHLPPIILSHFALYSMFIKLLHCPKSHDEIELADKIIHYYCQTASQIYDKTIELFSLHAHLHLPQQVLTHGGLCFTSAFCFESAIRYLKKKAHGTRNLGTQIADWINYGTVVTRSPFHISKPTGINNISINDHIFDKYRNDFLNALHSFNQDENYVLLFLRFKDVFVTYHTLLYDLSFTCKSYIISYKSMNLSIKYGQVIVFFKYQDNYYAFIQEYKPTAKTTSDYVSLPDYLKPKLNELFPVRSLSKSYTVVPVINICHKCIEVKYDDYVFLSEIRVDYEHD